MTDEGVVHDEQLAVGARLRAARESQQLDLADIATRTRIPLRHLEAIERSEYDALPSSTYALGFVRSYARAVGMPTEDVTRDLRAELGREPPVVRVSESYDPSEPGRVPGRLLAWTAVILAVLVLGGYGLWRSGAVGNDTPMIAVAPAPTAPSATPVAPTPVAARGEVVLTASAPVWVNISDGAKSLLKKEMAAGERFVVPGDATAPTIVTGRPEALAVTVDGRSVAPLGPPAKTVRNASLKAAALTAPATTPATPTTATNG